MFLQIQCAISNIEFSFVSEGESRRQNVDVRVLTLSKGKVQHLSYRKMWIIVRKARHTSLWSHQFTDAKEAAILFLVNVWGKRNRGANFTQRRWKENYNAYGTTTGGSTWESIGTLHNHDAPLMESALIATEKDNGIHLATKSQHRTQVVSISWLACKMTNNDFVQLHWPQWNWFGFVTVFLQMSPALATAEYDYGLSE